MSTGKRTGGRSAVVLAQVRHAVEDLVKERGAERVTIPLIAERAGVNPTSIYRRWGDLPTMLNDIATYRLDPDRPLPDTGEPRADLVAWAGEIVEHYAKPVNAALLRGGAAAAGETESDCLRNRRAEAVVLASRSGAPFAADDLIDLVISPIIYRVIFLPWTLTPDLAARCVDRLLTQRTSGGQAAGGEVASEA
ncbi:TetR/AcrR family transcriptional regulator [Dactylosporangium sp. NPDC005555]|uniref:TetR/AcrR family transcriptional regulator n=1 Tax=Dactylosporangium sp. NPDC005555 TaxID=3154889 RepID=UPI0033B6051F